MRVPIFPCLFAVLLVACRSGDPGAAGRSTQGEKPLLRIVLGEGGGITGTWDGYTITGDGIVYAWHGHGARENEQVVGHLPADTMLVLRSLMAELDTVTPVHTSGDLVRFLEVTSPDSTREYTWRPRVGTNPSGDPFQKIHARCLAVIRTSMIPTNNPTNPSTK